MNIDSCERQQRFLALPAHLELRGTVRHGIIWSDRCSQTRLLFNLRLCVYHGTNDIFIIFDAHANYHNIIAIHYGVLYHVYLEHVLLLLFLPAQLLHRWLLTQNATGLGNEASTGKHCNSFILNIWSGGSTDSLSALASTSQTPLVVLASCGVVLLLVRGLEPVEGAESGASRDSCSMSTMATSCRLSMDASSSSGESWRYFRHSTRQSSPCTAASVCCAAALRCRSSPRRLATGCDAPRTPWPSTAPTPVPCRCETACPSTRTCPWRRGSRLSLRLPIEHVLKDVLVPTVRSQSHHIRRILRCR